MHFRFEGPKGHLATLALEWAYSFCGPPFILSGYSALPATSEQASCSRISKSGSTCQCLHPATDQESQFWFRHFPICHFSCKYHHCKRNTINIPFCMQEPCGTHQQCPSLSSISPHFLHLCPWPWIKSAHSWKLWSKAAILLIFLPSHVCSCIWAYVLSFANKQN